MAGGVTENDWTLSSGSEPLPCARLGSSSESCGIILVQMKRHHLPSGPLEIQAVKGLNSAKEEEERNGTKSGPESQQNADRHQN